MDQEMLEHLSRIGTISELLLANPGWCYSDSEEIIQILMNFDATHWNFTKYLSLSLYKETANLLQEVQAKPINRPNIAVVMAVYKPNRELLQRAVTSAVTQIGVNVRLYISLDGPEGDEAQVADILKAHNLDPSQVKVLLHPINRGIGPCRNKALWMVREPWFTFLDSDDIFHPLRCLHAWLAMQSLKVERLNTGFSRVCLRTGKIVLLQQSLSATGGSSFIASSGLLTKYGYLADLRFFEDTEYERRLSRFGVAMTGCQAIGHYANTELEPGYTSLSSRWRLEVYAINDHPWLQGTVIGGLDKETEEIRDYYDQLYENLCVEDAPTIFPANPEEP
jgi:glycosyltransferase involved in cell wall biosynthesis